MKKWYVYELINHMGTVEYVGETENPKNRIRLHRCKNGNFHKRADIIMHIVKEFTDKKEAFWYQVELQKEYGLKPDNEKLSRVFSDEHRMNLSKAKKHYKVVTCPHCGKNGKLVGRTFQYHFDKCMSKIC